MNRTNKVQPQNFQYNTEVNRSLEKGSMIELKNKIEIFFKQPSFFEIDDSSRNYNYKESYKQSTDFSIQPRNNQLTSQNTLFQSENEEQCEVDQSKSFNSIDDNEIQKLIDELLLMDEQQAAQKLKSLGVRDNLELILDFLNNIDNAGFDHEKENKNQKQQIQIESEEILSMITPRFNVDKFQSSKPLRQNVDTQMISDTLQILNGKQSDNKINIMPSSPPLKIQPAKPSTESISQSQEKLPNSNLNVNYPGKEQLSQSKLSFNDLRVSDSYLSVQSLPIT
ncbi:UNKNOWN [Stylonychia lemnae]|uniref:Uncharacterized protein n=1 Tax=Stylonychia lemnae TaxID=5949 RepID=A0A077ZS07_STYLE|nr:UNKNOWN [Stylonychia lemnae]|eukprot:CDW72688.1 UNKNOWN [Stylonychia lemnae]